MTTVIMKYYSLPWYQFSDTYNCGAYGSDVYNSAQVCGTTTGGQQGSLLDTGIPLELVGGIAILMITAALAIKFFWPKKSTRNDYLPAPGPDIHSDPQS